MTLLDSSAATPLTPLFMTTKTIGNDPTETLNYTGINTTGLLVRIAGTVTGVVPSENVVYVDDGASYMDGIFPVLGIEVHVPSGVSLPQEYDTVIVTGISRVQAVTLLSQGQLKDGWWPAGTVLYVPGVWARDVNDISDIGDVSQQ